MKVFNLTDVPTSALKAVGWVNTTIQVGSLSVAPGKSIDVPEKFRAELSKYIRPGALALDEAPKGYTAACKSSPTLPSPSMPPVLVRPEPPALAPEPEPEPETEPELPSEVDSVEPSPEEGGGSRRRRRRS